MQCAAFKPSLQKSGTSMREFQPTLLNEKADDDDPACNGLMVTAEREFVAFTRTVTELSGPEEARLSAEDWLNEVASRDYLPGPTTREWRLVTVAALARLTIRLAAVLDYSGTVTNL
jgi:hypothetical protein